MNENYTILKGLLLVKVFIVSVSNVFVATFVSVVVFVNEEFNNMTLKSSGLYIFVTKINKSLRTTKITSYF